MMEFEQYWNLILRYEPGTKTIDEAHADFDGMQKRVAEIFKAYGISPIKEAPAQVTDNKKQGGNA